MTDNAPENPGPDEPQPLDLSALQASDIPAPESQPAPDHKASREARRNRLFKPAGDRADDKSSRSKAKPKKPTPRAKKGAFVEPLTQIYVGLGMTLMPMDPVCANAVIQSAEQCARTMDELAYQNEAVRRFLTSLTTTSAVGAVIFAHMPIVMAVVLHHVPAAQRAMGEMGSAMAENIAQQMGNTPNDGEADAA